MQLPPDPLRQPQPDQRLIGDRLHRGELAERLDLHRVELDGEVLEPAAPLPGQDLTAELHVEGELRWFVHELIEDSASVVVLGDALPRSTAGAGSLRLRHRSVLAVSPVVPALRLAQPPSIEQAMSVTSE
ncbi:MAG: hypothetical protein HY906_17635 [Deltaproteobacteria bacterium]|nr:hypothetical protein [Deltaproteobacteria bacterium]